jgi:hypothetical protein
MDDFKLRLGSWTPADMTDAYLITALPVQSGGVPWMQPQPEPQGQAGAVEAGDRHLYPYGGGVHVWRFSALSRAQLGYLSSTFCGGGLSGEVTFVSYDEYGGSWRTFTGMMQLPLAAKLNFRADVGYENVEVTFVSVVEVPAT